MSIDTEVRLNLEFLNEYKKLTEVESAIKNRKEEIKKYFKKYFEDNNTTNTPEYNGLIGTLEEKTSYFLNPEVLESNLEPNIFNYIAQKNINLDKTKELFLEGLIPIELIRTAEGINTSKSFHVRKFSTEDKKSNKTIPFWKVLN